MNKKCALKICAKFSGLMMKSNPSNSTTPVRIWDLPIRIFHVAFALCVTGAILTVKLSDNWMDLHVKFGIATLALLSFRLIWGFVGSRYARFTQFVKSPQAAWRYLRASRAIEHKQAGHNPLGAWSVLAMLLIIGIQAVTGLFTSDDILTAGPFANSVSEATGALMTRLHHINEKPLFIILGLHILAITIYSLKRHSLIKPMITGDKPANQLPVNTQSANDGIVLRFLALVLALVLAVVAYWLITKTG
jgi:cytochrome b